MPDPRMDSLRPAGDDVLDLVADVFGMRRWAAPAAQHRHPLDETISEATAGIAQVRVSLKWLAEGIDAAMLRGEDPADIVRQIAVSAKGVRRSLDELIASVEGE